MGQRKRKPDRIYLWMRKFSIYTRLKFSYFFIIILSICLVASLLSYSYIINTKKLIVSYLEENTQYYNDSLTQGLASCEAVLNKITSDYKLIQLIIENKSLYSQIEDYPVIRQKYFQNKNTIGRILYSYGTQNRSIEGLYVIGENDVYISIFPWGDKQGALIDRERFQKVAAQVEDKKPKWNILGNEGCFINSQGKSIVLTQNLKIMNHDLGVLMIQLSPDFLTRLTKRNLYTNSDIIIKDQSEILNLSHKEDIPLQDDLFLEHQKVYETKRYLIISQANEYTGWKFFSVVLKHDMYVSLYKSILVIVMIGLVVLGISVAVAWKVTQSISHPIKKLKKEAESIERSLEFHYTDFSHDEVGVLAVKIKQMVDRIKTLLNDVHEREICNKQEEIRRKQAELDALQMQINPHFIYNTLEIIRSELLLKYQDETQASNMLELFSNLFRIGTIRANKLVRIEEEIEHIKLYLAVLGFSDYYKIRLSLDIQHPLQQFYIPKLTLQPLVENCIKHGFEKLKNNKELQIKFYAQEDVFIEVMDNGKGLSREKVEKLNGYLRDQDIHPRKKIGIKNVFDRISLSFGPRYGLEFIESEQGSKVLVRLPLIENFDKGDHQNVSSTDC